MPTPALRELTSRDRTQAANRRLGRLLAFIAGAMNAGGFLLVHRYTSHMTGIVSSLADDLVLGSWNLMLTGALLVGAFVLGAITTAIVANWARTRGWYAEYAPCVALEGLLLLVFAAYGFRMGPSGSALAAAALLLCFIMGLQNAMVTKVSRAEIRTTHVTGILTDIGIELGRLLYANRSGATSPGSVRIDRERLSLHASLLGLFVLGGVAGAFAFQRVGALAAVPLAVILLGISVPSIWRDARA
jgi:uncharacterized membrane protein YoaK (UPF0700 family)